MIQNCFSYWKWNRESNQVSVKAKLALAFGRHELRDERLSALKSS